MQPRSTACFSIEQGAKMHRLLMPECPPSAARDRLQRLMQTESSTTGPIIGPPLIQLPLVNCLLLCFTHLSRCQQSQTQLEKGWLGLVNVDDLKAQQPGKMWGGVGAAQPSVTPSPLLTGPICPAAFCRVSPSCCYFVVVIYLQRKSDEMSEAMALLLVPGAARELFFEMIWHQHSLQQSSSPARGQRESGAGPSVGQTW